MTLDPAPDIDLSLVDALPHIVWIDDGEGNVSYFNQQWTTYTGLSLAQTRADGAAARVHPMDLPTIAPLFARARTTGEPIEAEYRLKRVDGTYRWHHARVVPLQRGNTSSWLGTAIDVHEERVLAQERDYLVKASRVLGTSLDLDRTLSDVARLLVPHIADWCAVDLLDETGTLQRTAVAHIDPAKIELASEIWHRVPPKPDDPSGSYNVIRTGLPELTPEITDEMLVAGVPDPEILALFRQLGLRSAMVVPMRARDHVIGTMSLVSAEGERLFEQRDLAFATDLATRMAIAVDNARLYGEATRAREAAEAMAQELLEQCRLVEESLLKLRRERDDAVARVKVP